MTTSSIKFGSVPACSRAAPMACPPNSTALRGASPPPNLPMAVRLAPMIAVGMPRAYDLNPYPENVTGTTAAIGLAVLAGVLVTIQAQMLGALGDRLGSVASGALTFAVGGVVGLLVLVVVRPDLSQWREAPWWAWLGGVAGLGIVTSLAFAVPRVGTTPVLTIVIAAQLIAALVLEKRGWLGAAVRPVDLPRLAGVALVALGSWLAIR